MHGAAHALYAPGVTLLVPVSVVGELTVSVPEAAHFNKTKSAIPVGEPLVCTNAICVPSNDVTGEVRINPASVLYAQFTVGTVPPHPEYRFVNPTILALFDAPSNPVLYTT